MRPMVRLGWRRSVEIAGRMMSVSSSKESPPWLQQFNSNISVNPTVTIPLYLIIRNATWYGLVGALSFADIGPEFAVAYLTAKVTSKFRQPVNLSLAALIARAFPVFGHVKASSLLYIPLSDKEKSSKNTSIASQLAEWTTAPLDKYGFSFYVASKITAFVTIGGTAALIRQGIDLSDTLASLGVSTTAQDVGGAMGAATMINILLIPPQLWFLGYIAPNANKYLADMRQK